jgi:hypothetical protein
VCIVQHLITRLTVSIKKNKICCLFVAYSLYTYLSISVAEPDPNPDPDPPNPHVLDLLDPDPDPLVRGMNPDPAPDFLSLKNDVNVPLKSNTKKNFFLKLVFCWRLEDQERK